jgi:hypothetical protein
MFEQYEAQMWQVKFKDKKRIDVVLVQLSQLVSIIGRSVLTVIKNIIAKSLFTYMNMSVHIFSCLGSM